MKKVLMTLVLFTVAGGAIGALASTTTRAVTPEIVGVQHTIYPVVAKSSVL